MEVGIKIKKLRENRRLSQEELAYQLDISQTKLSNIENGTTKAVDFEMLNKVCAFFGVDFEYFLENKQVNKVKQNEGGVVGNNFGTINNFPENILTQIKLLIKENQDKSLRIVELENELKKFLNT